MRSLTSGRVDKENIMSKSTSQLRISELIGPHNVTASEDANRLSLSAGTSSRLSGRNKIALAKKTNVAGDWHDNILQTSRVLHEQTAHIAFLMSGINASEAVDSFGDSPVLTSTLTPRTKATYAVDLRAIVSKVSLFCSRLNEMN